MELFGIQKSILDSNLFLMLISNVIILIQIVIDPHVPSQVNCWQFGLYIHFMGESLQVVRSLFRIEQRMVSINPLLFVQIR